MTSCANFLNLSSCKLLKCQMSGFQVMTSRQFRVMRIIITIELPSTAALGTYVKTQYSENVSIESHLIKKYFWDFKISGGIIGRLLTEGCYWGYNCRHCTHCFFLVTSSFFLKYLSRFTSVIGAAVGAGVGMVSIGNKAEKTKKIKK